MLMAGLTTGRESAGGGVLVLGFKARFQSLVTTLLQALDTDLPLGRSLD